MAAVSIDIYVGDRLLRTYGGNKSDVRHMRKFYEGLEYPQFSRLHEGVTEEEFKKLQVFGYNGKGREVTDVEKEKVKNELLQRYSYITTESIEAVFRFMQHSNCNSSKTLNKINKDAYFRKSLGILNARENSPLKSLYLLETEIIRLISLMLDSTGKEIDVEDTYIVSKLWRKLSIEQKYKLYAIYEDRLKLCKITL